MSSSNITLYGTTARIFILPEWHDESYNWPLEGSRPKSCNTLDNLSANTFFYSLRHELL